MEQVRPQTPTKDEDEWSTALDYVSTAQAGGLDMQFGRRTSMDRALSLEPSMSQSLSLLLEASGSGLVGGGAQRRRRLLHLPDTWLAPR